MEGCGQISRCLVRVETFECRVYHKSDAKSMPMRTLRLAKQTSRLNRSKGLLTEECNARQTLIRGDPGSTGKLNRQC